MSCRGRVQLCRRRGNGHGSHAEDGHDGDQLRGLGLEPLGAMAEPTHKKCDAQNEQAVSQNRANQRRLHDGDESGSQREDPDKERWEVPQRGLQDARRTRPQADAELLVPSPTSEASAASATAETMNVSTLEAPAATSTPVRSIETDATAMVIKVFGPTVCSRGAVDRLPLWDGVVVMGDRGSWL